MNTAMIVATQMADNQSGNFAAQVCADYSVTMGGVTYGDWYLPSKYELNLLYQQEVVVGGFANSGYWSSSEYDALGAWFQFFSNGFQTSYLKSNSAYSAFSAWNQYFDNGDQTNGNKSYTFYVRAVRAF
jgi:hypothetical protein